MSKSSPGIIFSLSVGIIASTVIFVSIYLVGTYLYQQRCEALGFKIDSMENAECTRILSSVPSEYHKVLLDNLRNSNDRRH